MRTESPTHRNQHRCCSIRITATAGRRVGDNDDTLRAISPRASFIAPAAAAAVVASGAAATRTGRYIVLRSGTTGGAIGRAARTAGTGVARAAREDGSATIAVAAW